MMLLRKILVAVLFAVTMLGGSQLPILHAPQFAEAHAFVHQHMEGAANTAHVHESASILGADARDREHNDADREPGSDHGCTHVHAHCCAATAILASAISTPAVAGSSPLRIELNSSIPYGQLSHPPLRPPRAAA
jgi:hypothetical protein